MALDAELAISRLLDRYADAVTRRAWDEVAALFVPGCPVRLDLRSGHAIETTGPDGLIELVSGRMDRFDFFLLVPLSSVADVDPGGRTASGRFWFREIRRARDGERWSTTYGVYLDTYAEVDGSWRFASRSYATLARTRDDGSGTDVFDLPA